MESVPTWTFYKTAFNGQEFLSNTERVALAKLVVMKDEKAATDKAEVSTELF